ncbi:sister chromatid cohesion protein pds5 [Quercus suber]|uniref:Sister chromatid cohesion protein pds5 n=1 Tax=Quercus suber TaxID=58331 RepID=A0AAW0J591_QUESU|nr:sister chromatid cohesion protein pds5 [Quercus suber]POE61465.1 sister chromatid cohesion protein pds5 [Quercus suber]
MTSFDKELEKQLKETGNRLLNPPSSIDDLFILLDEIKNLLTYVEQAPSKLMRDALLPLVKALITNKLLRNAEMDMKISVVSCITEITRITAPDTPYKDEQMKEIFQLIVAAFETLSNLATHSYTKVVSILDTVTKVKLP